MSKQWKNNKNKKNSFVVNYVPKNQQDNIDQPQEPQRNNNRRQSQYYKPVRQSENRRQSMMTRSYNEIRYVPKKTVQLDTISDNQSQITNPSTQFTDIQQNVGMSTPNECSDIQQTRSSEHNLDIHMFENIGLYEFDQNGLVTLSEKRERELNRSQEEEEQEVLIKGDSKRQPIEQEEDEEFEYVKRHGKKPVQHKKVEKKQEEEEEFEQIKRHGSKNLHHEKKKRGSIDMIKDNESLQFREKSLKSNKSSEKSLKSDKSSEKSLKSQKSWDKSVKSQKSRDKSVKLHHSKLSNMLHDSPRSQRSKSNKSHSSKDNTLNKSQDKQKNSPKQWNFKKREHNNWENIVEDTSSEDGQIIKTQQIHPILYQQEIEQQVQQETTLTENQQQTLNENEINNQTLIQIEPKIQDQEDTLQNIENTEVQKVQEQSMQINQQVKEEVKTQQVNNVDRETQNPLQRQPTITSYLISGIGGFAGGVAIASLILKTDRKKTLLVGVTLAAITAFITKSFKTK